MAQFNRKLKFEDVNADCIEKGMVVRVNESTIKHEIRSSRLHIKLGNEKHSDERLFELGCAIKLISVTTNTETGEFLFDDDQLEYFTDNVPSVFLTNLMLANNRVNPVDVEEVKKSLTVKKKST